MDEYLELVRSTGKLDAISFASKRDPCDSFFKKVMSVFQPRGQIQNNIGVTLSINMPHRGPKDPEKPVITGINGHSNGINTLHLKTDSTLLKKIDPETLEPIGIATQRKLHHELVGQLSGAHAKSDPITGDVFNFNLEMAYTSMYRVFRSNADTGKTDVLATFPGTPAYIHSLFLTENYVVLCVWNSHISYAGLSVLYHKNLVDAISPFNPKDKARWYVVDRRHGKGLVATYESEPFFSFHSINAWEEQDAEGSTNIITELSMYENTDVIHRFFYENMMSNTIGPKYTGTKRESCLPMLARFRLSGVNSGSPSAKRSAELAFKADKMLSSELPTINPSYLTRRHRYVYGCADRLKSSFMDGITKFDNTTQTAIYWETEGHTPGEPIFVADPEGKAEDDGVLLSVVLDGHEGKSYLLVLRAQDLTELGRAEMRGPMAFGFHGAYKASENRYCGDI